MSAPSFDRLYRNHVDRLHRFAQRICGPSEEAYDLVQETFLNAYRGLPAFRGEAQLSTWLYRIAVRACARMHRGQRGDRRQDLSLDALLPDGAGPWQRYLPVERRTPEKALENKQLREALNKALDALPKPYRVVLVLRDMEGLRAKEVGAIMGLSERAVKSRLHRARLFIRKALAAEGLV